MTTDQVFDLMGDGWRLMVETGKAAVLFRRAGGAKYVPDDTLLDVLARSAKNVADGVNPPFFVLRQMSDDEAIYEYRGALAGTQRVYCLLC